MKGLTDEEFRLVEICVGYRPPANPARATDDRVALIDRLVARGLLIWEEEKTPQRHVRYPATTTAGKVALECERLARSQPRF